MNNLYAIPLFIITLGLGTLAGYLCGRDCHCNFNYEKPKEDDSHTETTPSI